MKTKILIFLLTLLLATSLIATACAKPAPAPAPVTAPAPAPKAEVYKWRMQTMWPGPAYHQWPSIDAFADYARRASNGRLDIEIFTPGTVVPTLELFEAVGKGMLEIGHSLPAYEGGKMPVFNIGYGLPYTFDNHNEMSVYYYDLGLLDIMREEAAKHNVFFLGPTMSHHVTLLTKKPIRTIEDFKGLKLRSTGLCADVMAKAGASCVFLPGPEIYPSLEKGVIDGTHWGAEGAMYSMGFHEVTKYDLTPHMQRSATLEVFINMDKWNSLPDDLKAILEMALQVFSIMDGNINERNDYLHREILVKEFGFEVTHFPPEDEAKMRQFTMEVLDEYSAKDAAFAKAADIMKDYLRLMGRIK